MNRREFCLGTLALTAGCSAGENEMPQEYTIQASPVRTQNNADTSIPPYAFGQWTPGIDFGGGTTGITYAIQSGFYTKIGRLVVCHFAITLTAKGASTGTANITGLPFTASPDFVSQCNPVEWYALGTNWVNVKAVINLNTNYCTLTGAAAAATANTTLLDEGDFTDTSQINGTIIYTVTE